MISLDLHSEKETATPVPLDQVRRPCRVEVVEVSGGRGARQMMAQLDIHLGQVLRVKRSAPLGGPILVESTAGVVALGRGLARKVQVRVLP